MIPELIAIAKGASLVGGGWLAKALITKWLGKTKQEAEIVLNWEEIHEKRDKKLLSEIKRLEDKLDEFINKMELERANHKREILLWEESDRKKDIIIEEKVKVISDQSVELANKDAEIKKLRA